MTLDDLKNEMQNRLQHAPPLGADVKVTIPDEGHVFINGINNEVTLCENDAAAETTLICSLDVISKIAQGTQDPTMAYMMGKLKVQGSMGFALKLASALGD